MYGSTVRRGCADLVDSNRGVCMGVRGGLHYLILEMGSGGVRDVLKI